MKRRIFVAEFTSPAEIMTGMWAHYPDIHYPDIQIGNMTATLTGEVLICVRIYTLLGLFSVLVKTLSDYNAPVTASVYYDKRRHFSSRCLNDRK